MPVEHSAGPAGGEVLSRPAVHFLAHPSGAVVLAVALQPSLDPFPDQLAFKLRRHHPLLHVEETLPAMVGQKRRWAAFKMWSRNLAAGLHSSVSMFWLLAMNRTPGPGSS